MQRYIGAAVISLGLFSPSAHAADAAPPATTFTVGAGVAVVPEYSGGDEYRTPVLLVLDYQHASGFFASTREGLGYKTKMGAFGMSAALSYEGYRADHKRDQRGGSDTLRGMGDIHASTVARLGVSYELDSGISFGVRAALALTNREKGNHYQFGMLAPVLRTERDKVSLFAFADYGDNKHMQTYYGVTPTQSLNTALRYKPYMASAGFSKVGTGVNWNRKLSDKWSINSSLGVTHLVGDAADSPLTKKKTAAVYATTVNYAF